MKINKVIIGVAVALTLVLTSMNFNPEGVLSPLREARECNQKSPNINKMKPLKC